jgi:hypothetical protein
MFPGDSFTVQFTDAPPPSSSGGDNKYSYENPPAAPVEPEIAFSPATTTAYVPYCGYLLLREYCEYSKTMGYINTSIRD